MREEALCVDRREGRVEGGRTRSVLLAASSASALLLVKSTPV
jgi:hypothetical protein